MIASGTRLGPYEVLDAIGAGGMGEVYKGRDTRLDRSVAIKVLPPHLASNPDFKLRFEREARVISGFNHPNICTLHDVGDGFLVMEFCDGQSLAERLARGPLPVDQVFKYGIQIADALDRAHRGGIVHRDLKPGNVLFDESGLPKITDFGLAKLAGGGDLTSAVVLRVHVTRAIAEILLVRRMSKSPRCQGQHTQHHDDQRQEGEMDQAHERLLNMRIWSIAHDHGDHRSNGE